MSNSKTIAMIKLLAQSMPENIQYKTVEMIQTGSAEFISKYGIDSYMYALKDIDEGTQVVYCVDGEPTENVATIIEYVGDGKSTNVDVRFEIDGNSMRMSAHNFAKTFRTLPCADLEEATVRALARSYALGKWLSENTDIADEVGCDGCDDCTECGDSASEGFGESGIVPEAPSAIEELLEKGATPDTESRKTAKQESASKLLETVLGQLLR